MVRLWMLSCIDHFGNWALLQKNYKCQIIVKYACSQIDYSIWKKNQEKEFSAKAFRIALSSAGESLILSKSVFAKSGEEVNGKSWNNLISDTIAKKGMLSPSVLRS